MADDVRRLHVGLLVEEPQYQRERRPVVTGVLRLQRLIGDRLSRRPGDEARRGAKPFDLPAQLLNGFFRRSVERELY